MKGGREGRAAGRWGMGAVMASKNLKAIVVDRTGNGSVHDWESARPHRGLIVSYSNGNLFPVTWPISSFQLRTSPSDTTSPELNFEDGS
jgi:hypothetical protein